jgi:hypothetical protein
MSGVAVPAVGEDGALLKSAPAPTAVFSVALAFNKSVAAPTAVLKLPSRLFRSERKPTAAL